MALQGQKGAGKTHLLGWVREKIQGEGGYFFLVSLLDGNRFWESAALSILDGLSRNVDGQENQLTIFLRRISALTKLPSASQDGITGETNLSRAALNDFVQALRRLNNQVGIECQDTARALVLYGSNDFEAQDIGYTYLLSMEEARPGDRRKWGIQRPGIKQPQLIVKELSRLLSLTGPSVMAIDQIDTLIAQSMKSIHNDESSQDDDRQVLLLEHIAGGLMSIREVARRTLSVVACLPNTWILIKSKATDTVGDRFREAMKMHTVPSPETGMAIIEKRFCERFREIGFKAPYPTWPVKPSAFSDAPDFTPRGLLRRVDDHITSCLRSGIVHELERLSDAPSELSIPGHSSPTPPPQSQDLAELDARLTDLKKRANVEALLDPETEDKTMPGLLSAGLAAWIAEGGDCREGFTQDPPPSAKPAIHARLRQSLDENTEDEVHWAFRAIATHNAVAALNRVRAACTAAGLDQGVPKRKLILLRNNTWSSGPRTREAIAKFQDSGGVTLSIREVDLRTFAALKDMLAQRPCNLKAWLAARKPAGNTELFRGVFGDGPTNFSGNRAEADSSVSNTPAKPIIAPAPSGPAEDNTPAIPLGVAVTTGQLASVNLEHLRKHTAIFAGSGSGKTVLIRRLIEECALHGVSSIVLDPNNDLARLGDRWPEPPKQWTATDAAKERDYLANTDVVVWTPRREAGRPLSFQPLPDFASVLDDPDEFRAAIDAAVAALAPRAKVEGSTDKAGLGQAVLRQALRFFAKQREKDLRAFIGVLSALPEGVSELDSADKIAASMARSLTAAIVNDPLFGGGSETVDPGLLLTPPAGKRARVSVISFVGLPSDDQRQSFVNQLQMALFAWIKKNPAGDRPLGGLFVMDEAQTLSPAGAMTACTLSTIKLASQARKYGLGLVFATQAPKGLHNQIPGNAATQFFGFLNSPVQIAAAREMAQAKGGDVLDISRLRAGQFYAASEGLAFEKLQIPLCLSHHPASALTAEEVISRASRGSAKSAPSTEIKSVVQSSSRRPKHRR